MTLEVHGNLYNNGLVLAHFEQVDVQNSVANGVELQVLQDGLAGLSVVGQFDYINVGAVDQLANVGLVHYQVGGDDALAVTADGNDLLAGEQLAIVITILVQVNELATRRALAAFLPRSVRASAFN